MAFAMPVKSADVSADQLLAEGRVDDAIASLQSRVSSDEADADSYNLLCRAYYTLGDWDRAITECQKAVTMNPSNSQFHLWLGRVYGRKASETHFLNAAGLAKKARNEFETAVSVDPNNVDARADLADFYMNAPGVLGGGKDKAEAQAKEMAPLNLSQADLVRAKIAEKKNDASAAEMEYRDAIQASGGNAGPWLSLAQFYSRSKQFDQMQDAIQHAVSARNSQLALMPAAELLIRTKSDPTQAAQLLQRYLDGGTIETYPAFRAHYLLGTLLEKQGDTQSAAQQYRAALALAQKFSPAEHALKRLDQHDGEGQSTPSSTVE